MRRACESFREQDRRVVGPVGGWRYASFAAACLAAVSLGASPLAHADIPGALKALASGNYSAAAEQLRPSAENGDIASQLALGQVLRNPSNPQRMPEEALRWFTRAAEQNSAEGSYWLGVMHRLGEGVPRDYEQSMKYWRAAAAAGSANAQGALAQALFAGDGVPKDAVEAVRWAREGAERGNALAQFVLAQAHLKGEGGAQRNFSEFLRWTRRAAAQGNRPSMEALAVSYHTGTGVPQDFVQAHVWANLAAARGSTRAVKLRD
jgi:TPR repeat protein